MTHLLKLRRTRFKLIEIRVVFMFGFSLAACGGSSFDAGRGDASAGGTGGAPAATGGASSTCSQGSDCTNCAYPKAPEDSSQCYCAICAATPMTPNRNVKPTNRHGSRTVPTSAAMACPAIACVLPAAAVCANGQCVAAATGTAN